MNVYGPFTHLPVMETPRLVLRPVTRADVADVFEYASNPEVARYVPWEVHRTIIDAEVYVNTILTEYAGNKPSVWGIVHREHGKLIGTAGFARWTPHNAYAEIGYALSQAYWNRGLTSEAVLAVLRFAFGTLRTNRVDAACDVENTGSERVMQKVGMTFEGILRERLLFKGRFHDLKLYSILRREYEARHGAIR